MPLNVREKAKINPKRNRFALINYPDLTGPNYFVLVDRDADPVWTAEKEGRHVARVAKPYARALLALMNRGDHSELLALKPAKRQTKAKDAKELFKKLNR